VYLALKIAKISLMVFTRKNFPKRTEEKGAKEGKNFSVRVRKIQRREGGGENCLKTLRF